MFLQADTDALINVEYWPSNHLSAHLIVPRTLFYFPSFFVTPPPSPIIEIKLTNQ